MGSGYRGELDAGEGDALAPLERFLRRLGLADADEPLDPDLPPFQGGLIGTVGYDLAPQIERLPRRWDCQSRESHDPDGVLRHRRYGRPSLGPRSTVGLDLPGRHRRKAVHRLRRWKTWIERDVGLPPPVRIRPPHPMTADQLVRPRHLSGDGSPGAGVHRRRATSSRSTSRSGSRPADCTIRWTSICGSSDRSPAAVRRVSALERSGRRSRPAPSCSIRPEATAS